LRLNLAAYLVLKQGCRDFGTYGITGGYTHKEGEGGLTRYVKDRTHNCLEAAAYKAHNSKPYEDFYTNEKGKQGRKDYIEPQLNPIISCPKRLVGINYYIQYKYAKYKSNDYSGNISPRQVKHLTLQYNILKVRRVYIYTYTGDFK
jgi:hypothetical protein